MTRTHEFGYPSADGIHRIFAKEWLPDTGAPRAVVQIAHGVAEHIERYDAFARYLAGRGIVVTGGDHLGHGRTATDGQYGYFADRNGWEFVLQDIRKLRTIQGEKHPGIPYFLLGHSMGSLLARHYLIQWPGTLAGAILSGTLQMASPVLAVGRRFIAWRCKRLGPKGVSNIVQRLTFGAYNLQFSPNRTAADWISRDEKTVDDYIADPLCQFPISVGLYCDMLGGMQSISDKANLRQMDPDTPVFFFAGAKDPAGRDGAGVRQAYKLFQRAGCTDVTLKLYPDGRHEMLNEINRDEVYADTLTWLEQHM